MQALLNEVRQRVASNQGLLALCVIGVVIGLVTGLLMALLHLLIALGQQLFLPSAENYEAMLWWARSILVLGGAIILGWVLQTWFKDDLPVGVLHVMESLLLRHGQMTWRGVIIQFFAATWALITGQSVGREGPSVHIGAGAGAALGRELRLPRNTMRILVACGVAGAISGSFNTPLAGVIFAMEVVLKEYTIVGFAPVILSAVTSNVITRMVERADPAFLVEMHNVTTATALPWLVIVGVAIGCLAAAFVWLVDKFGSTLKGKSLALRFGMAGLITAIISIAYPEVLGLGYDTVNSALKGTLGQSASGGLALGLLIGIALGKLVSSAAAIGYGIPAGLIGPLFVIGAVAGAILGHIGHMIAVDVLGLESATSPAFYALIGMGTMMGAVLQAPLAALTAILELTGNPNIIMPGMLTVVTAYLVCKVGFKRKPIFSLLLQKRGHKYHFAPGQISLERYGVRAVMDDRFLALPRFCREDLIVEPDETERGPLDYLRPSSKGWFVIQEDNDPIAVINATTLLEFKEAGGLQDDLPTGLLNLPVPHMKVATISARSTLWEAERRLDKVNADILVVIGEEDYLVQGIITRTTLEDFRRR